MSTQQEEHKEQAVSNSASSTLEKGVEATGLYEDLRTSKKQNLQLQRKANKSVASKHITQLQNMADATASFSPTVIQKKSSDTLPKQLQTGIESLSGESMHDVKVHYNSSEPKQLNAHAYAQGTDIHVAPGQEKHLPHEAWHVVQQKQGRVKPTKQLKKINTPKEADIEENNIQETHETMDKEAKSSSAEATPAPPPSDNNTKPNNTIPNKTIQRAANLPALDNSKPFNKDDVDALEPQETGANKAIELEGKLTTVAKIKGFFGKNSTWDKFTVLAQKFNNSKEVMEKRGMLPQLKALAEEWMRRHEEDKKDENIDAKTNTITAFLNSLKSNQEDIITAYHNLDQKMIGIVSAPVEKRHEFQTAINDYKVIHTLIETFKSNYPPSINLLYKEEIAQIHEADQTLTKQASITAGEFDTGVGLKMLGATAQINLEEQAYIFDGGVAFEIGNVKNATAKGKCILNPDGTVKDVIISEGGMTFETGETKITCNSVSYIHSSKQFTIGEATGELTIASKKVTLQAINAQITEGMFTYDQLHGIYNETFDTGFGFKVITPRVSVYKGGITELVGDLEMAVADQVEAKGNVHVKLDDQLHINHIKINKGQIKGKTKGCDIKMTNIYFNNATHAISAQHTKGHIELMGQTFNLTAEGMSYSNKTFSYKTLKGACKGTLDTGMGISVANPSIQINEDGTKTVNGGLDINLSEVTSLTGQVSLGLSASNSINTIDVEEGSGMANLMNISISLDGVGYTSETKSLTAEEATASANIFGKTITLTAEEVAFNNDQFNYSKITANLPDIEHEFFKLTGGYLTHTKATEAFHGSADYSFINEKAPEGLQDFKELSGILTLEWGKEKPAQFGIKNGRLKFSINDSSVMAQLEQFSYNSNEAVFNAEDITVTSTIPKVNKTLKGKNIAISKSGLQFSELSVNASDKHQLGLMELITTSYKLIHDDKGYGMQVDGDLGIKTPKYLKPKSGDEKISASGNVKLHFIGNREFEYNITAVNGSVQISNPLKQLNELFGESWTSSRYELSAGIPVFPGISAIFGLFMEYGASFDDYINLALTLQDNALSVDTESQFKINASAGVFGGVQGGSQLLIALAILLQAAGNFDMLATLGYHKTFDLKKKPESKTLKKDGLKYGLSGEIKAGVDLKLVATALYFFSKSLTFKLTEKSLGSFAFSNTKETPPNMEQPLVEDETIRDEIDDDKKEMAKGLSIQEIIDFEVTKRFDAREKRDTIAAIKDVEEERQVVHNAEVAENNETNAFNNVPLANLQFYHNFIDNRFDFKQIIAEMKAFGRMDKGLTSDTYLNKVNTLITKLGKIINTASVFVEHYQEKVEAFDEAYDYIADAYTGYKKMINEKYLIIDEINTFKSGHLHSSFWGDEKKLQRQLKTTSWFGDSNYEKLCTQYNALSAKLIAKESLFDNIQDASKDLGLKLLKAHKAQLTAEED